MADPQRVTVSLKIDPDVWQQAKLYAVSRKITLGQLVENTLLREMRGNAGKPGG